MKNSMRCKIVNIFLEASYIYLLRILDQEDLGIFVLLFIRSSLINGWEKELAEEKDFNQSVLGNCYLILVVYCDLYSMCLVNKPFKNLAETWWQKFNYFIQIYSV